METRSLDIEQIENYLASYLSDSLLLSNNNNKNNNSSQSQSVALLPKDLKKLTKLTRQQLLELATDAIDEINRRHNSDRPFLEFMSEYSAKRNQARQKLSDLKNNKFEELIYTIIKEMESRFGGKALAAMTMAMTASASAASLSSMESLKSPSAIPIQRMPSRSITPVGLKDSHKSSHSNINNNNNNNRDTINFEGLDNMMQELNLMIGKEQDIELQTLKMKHQQEVSELRSKLELLEQIIIPQKNQEIAKLVAKIDSIESKLEESKKEANQYYQLCQNKEKTIEEQNVLISNLQGAYQQLQNEIIIKNRELAESGQRQLQQLESLEQSSASASSNLDNLRELSASFESKMEQAIVILGRADPSPKEVLYSVKDLCSLARKMVKFTSIYHSKGGVVSSSLSAFDISEGKSKTLESVTYLIACCKDITAGSGGSAASGSNNSKNVFRPLRNALDSLKINMKDLLSGVLPLNQNNNNNNTSINSVFASSFPIGDATLGRVGGSGVGGVGSSILFDSHPRFNSTVSLPASQANNNNNNNGNGNVNGNNNNNGNAVGSCLGIGHSQASKEIQDIISLIHSKSDKVLAISEELLKFSRHYMNNNGSDDSSSSNNSPHSFRSFFSSFGSSQAKKEEKRKSIINALLPQHHLNMVNDMVGHLLVLIYRAKPILEDRKELHAMLELMEDSIQTLHREVVRTGGKVSKIDALSDIEAACSTIYKAMRQLESSI